MIIIEYNLYIGDGMLKNDLYFGIKFIRYIIVYGEEVEKIWEFFLVVIRFLWWEVI